MGTLLRLLTVTLTLLMIAGCVSMGKYRSKEDEARRYYDEVAELARQHQAALATLESTDEERSRHLEARRGLEQDTTQLQATITSLEETNANLSGVLQSSNAEKDLLIAAMNQAREQQDATIADLQRQLTDAADERAIMEGELELLGKESASTLAEVEANYLDLVSGLQSEIDEGAIVITSLQDKLTVTMVDQVLFQSGHAEVKSNGRKVLANLAEVLRNISAKQIQIEGHTDNVPIGKRLRAIYPSNWELSTARATNVARYLIEDLGLDPRYVSVVGFGEFRPVATNTSEEGRHTNRRIEIVLLPYEEPPFVEVPPPAVPDSLAVPVDTTGASMEDAGTEESPSAGE